MRRRGERHTIPDRYALTILEDTEAIHNYVKPVLADRIRELDEQVPKTDTVDAIRLYENNVDAYKEVEHGLAD